ncbi:hypothetical protein ACIBO1_23695 [Micromonospora sp. NPDC049903]|uniref:hypothetical protein n=1 Tax=Micromonospora sp. NPDC049903 TaxID=3364276 RepID=UPI00378EE12B
MTRRDRWRTGAVTLGLAVVLTLTACTGGGSTPDTAPEGRPGGGVGATDDGAPPAAFPGLYLAADVVPVESSDTRITLASGRRCRDLSAMLAAGQWHRVDRLTFGTLGSAEVALLAGFGGVAGDLLRRGDRLVFAGLEGDPACTATVTEVTRAEIGIEGRGLPGASPGWVATTRCYRSKADGTLTVSLYFDTEAKVGGQGQLVLTRSGDRYQVDDDTSALTLVLLRHSGRYLTSMSAVYAEPRRRPAGLSQLVAGDSFRAEVTVRDGTADRPAGTVEIAGLADESRGGKVTVSLPFTCAHVTEIR